jgi:hypothetical protein
MELFYDGILIKYFVFYECFSLELIFMLNVIYSFNAWLFNESWK